MGIRGLKDTWILVPCWGWLHNPKEMKLYTTSRFLLVHFAGRCIFHQNKTYQKSKVSGKDNSIYKRRSFESLICMSTGSWRYLQNFPMSDIYKEFSLRLKIWIEFQKETKLPMSKSSDKFSSFPLALSFCSDFFMKMVRFQLL